MSLSVSPSPKNLNRLTFNNNGQPAQNHDWLEFANLSLTASIQRQRSLPKQTPRTYQELEKYKKLFKKTSAKNP